MKKQSTYRYQGHENDGVDGFLCLNCFEHFSIRGARFRYCLYCGTEFGAMSIRPKIYYFTMPCSDMITEWLVESAIKWNEDDTEDDLNWTKKGYGSYSTPGEALESKQHYEIDVDEEFCRYEKHSGKEKRSFFEIFKVVRRKRNRKSWEFPRYHMSDFEYYEKVGKHITTCTHPNFINQGYME